MPPKPLIEINRSEMSKSVVLAHVLGHRRYLENFRGRCCPTWKMQAVDSDRFIDLQLGAPQDPLMTTALFHAWRDIENRDPDFIKIYRASCAKREIDVVVVIPNLVAIGIEIKWEGGLHRLKTQLQEERTCLRLIASYYNCPHISLAAILPHQQNLDGADAVMALADVSEFLDCLHEERPSDWYIKLASQEFSVTRDVIVSSWQRVKSVEELLALAGPEGAPAAANKWVGYIDGLDHLRNQTAAQLRRRPHWKVANTHLSRNWCSLAEVANIVREALAREAH